MLSPVSCQPEGMRRAIEAGVETIEHGDGGTVEIWKLMVERRVGFCPTLAAGDATAQYAGWKKGATPEPARITAKRTSFKAALDAERASIKIHVTPLEAEQLPAPHAGGERHCPAMQAMEPIRMNVAGQVR